MAKDRETRIPEQFDPQPPGWEIDGPPVRVPEPQTEAQQDQLYSAIEDAVTILRHIGGSVTIVPVRVELGPEVYKTVEYALRWNSFVPPIREKPEEQKPEVVEVPEQEPALAA